MKYKNGDTTFDINPENILRLISVSDIENENMPKLFGIFHLDKNFVDEIIRGAKTASIFITLQKGLADDETGSKVNTEYCGECMYLTNVDYNYNKELDYDGINATREDIYRELHLGFVFKQTNERNKQTENLVVNDTSMMNIVGSLLKDTPLLLESFTYNEIMDQLIVPPQESMSKALAFLNGVRVFYDTQYRFFIEPDFTCLMSSSGKAVPAAGEKYNTVIFNVNSITEVDALNPGMEEDDTNKCYQIDIHVKDTNYQVDNDSCKVVNSIQSIINPSKDNSIMSSDAMKNAISQIQSKFDNINSSIQAQVSAIKSMPNQIRGYKINITNNSNNAAAYGDTFTGLTNTLIDEIKALPETDPTAPDKDGKVDPTAVKPPLIMGPLEKQKRINDIKTLLTSMQNGITTFCNLKSLMRTSSTGTIGTMASLTNIPGIINSISPINAFDNKSALASNHTSLLNSSANNVSYIQQNLVPRISDGNGAVSSAQAIEKIAEELQVSPEILVTMQAMQPVLQSLKTEIDSANSTINSYKTIPSSLSGLVSNIGGSVKGITGININLADQITSYKTSLGSYASGAKDNVKNIVAAVSSSIQSISSKNLDASTIVNLQSNINAVKDIGKIGTTGLSNLSVDLFKTGGTGSTIVNISNDNANYIKNLKSSIENKVNRFTLNKNGLDCSIFTINKEYIIKNYQAHSDKDGKFLMTKRIFMWYREGDKFNLTSLLEFNKVAADTSSTTTTKDATKTSEQSTSGNSVIDTDSIVANGKDIINTVKSNGLSIDSLKSIVSDAASISKEYQKMNSTNSAKSIDATTKKN